MVVSNDRPRMDMLKSVLELLKSPEYTIDLVASATNEQDAYSDYLKNKPNMVVSDAEMFTPCLNIITANSEVFLISSGNHSDMNNVRYASIDMQCMYLLKKITKVFESYDFDTANAIISSYLDVLDFPVDYCPEIDTFCETLKKPSFVFQRNMTLNAIGDEKLVLHMEKVEMEEQVPDVISPTFDYVGAISAFAEIPSQKQILSIDKKGLAQKYAFLLPVEGDPEISVDFNIAEALIMIAETPKQKYNGTIDRASLIQKYAFLLSEEPEESPLVFDMVEALIMIADGPKDNIAGNIDKEFWSEWYSELLPMDAAENADFQQTYEYDAFINFMFSCTPVDLSRCPKPINKDRVIARLSAAIADMFPTAEEDIPDEGTIEEYDFPDSLTETIATVASEEAASVISVEFERLPCTEFQQGSVFSADGGILCVTFSNGSHDLIETTDEMLTKTYHTDKLGKQYVTLKVDGATVTYEITINPIPITIPKQKPVSTQPISIMMFSAPAKTVYPLRFQELNLDGGMLNVFYADNHCEQVVLSRENMDYTVNKNATGTVPVAVHYMGLTAIFPITLVLPKIVKLSVEQLPEKVAYFDGDKFQPQGMVIKATYDNCETSIITAFPELEHSLSLKDANVTVIKDSASILIPIKVEKRPVEAIRVKNLPTKTSYLEKIENLDLTGCILEHVLPTGKINEFPADNKMIKYFNNAKAGETKAILQFENLTCELPLQIIPDNIDKIEITKYPNKTMYIVGEDYDFSGMIISVRMKDGGIQQITEYKTDKVTAALSDTEIKISYQYHTAAIPVKVIEKELESISLLNMPDKLEYLEGAEEFNAKGGELLLTYNNGDTDTAKLLNENVSGFDNSKPGTVQLHIDYHGKKTEFPITITPKRLIALSVTTGLKKTSYTEGEKIDLSGLLLTGSYDNGQVLNVIDFSYTPTMPLTTLDHVMRISYENKVLSFPINVSPKTEEEKRVGLKQNAYREESVRFYPSSVGLRF